MGLHECTGRLRDETSPLDGAAHGSDAPNVSAFLSPVARDTCQGGRSPSSAELPPNAPGRAKGGKQGGRAPRAISTVRVRRVRSTAVRGPSWCSAAGSRPGSPSQTVSVPRASSAPPLPATRGVRGAVRPSVSCRCSACCRCECASRGEARWPYMTLYRPRAPSPVSRRGSFSSAAWLSVTLSSPR
jgi:hypothetical protein